MGYGISVLFGRKIRTFHIALACILIALSSATLYWFLSQSLSGDVITVSQASGLEGGRRATIHASVSSISQNQYGSYSCLACDYSGCIRCTLGPDMLSYTLADKPLLVTGKLRYTSSISKSLDITKLEYPG
ncbi:MAG: hypothetical protein WC506_03665 [Candidatus Micrarchaeia archaeon]